ncbi:MAG: HDOD domain-containing protein [Fimbriimonadaceae bacterium]|nr:HDOD domain-containing protein [Fimbriimonadaceae bacterium]
MIYGFAPGDLSNLDFQAKNQQGESLPMSYSPLFEDLRGRLSSDNILRDMPSSALRLCEAIDKGDASAQQLERIIISDPALTAGVLRAASAAAFAGYSRGATTIRQAIMVLGERAVRSLAVAVWVSSIVKNATAAQFSAALFANHSMFVGLTARYLFSRQLKVRGDETQLIPDEVFACAVLHDLGLGLLAAADPVTFDATMTTARAQMRSPDEAFFEKFEQYPGALAAEVLGSWQLPAIFVQALQGWPSPLDHKQEVTALACIHYANWIAERNKQTFLSWVPESPLSPELSAFFDLAEDDLATVIELIDGQMRAYQSAA